MKNKKPKPTFVEIPTQLAQAVVGGREWKQEED